MRGLKWPDISVDAAANDGLKKTYNSKLNEEVKCFVHVGEAP